MKNKLPYILKILIAGILAFIVLNLLCLVYYNIPNRKYNADKTTDYKWPSNSIYSRWNEGISYGQLNNEGFHNIDDYNDKKDIDVLLMGGSHAEALNVFDKETMSEILNQNNIKTYNIGISEHTLLHCVSNLEYAINLYKPTKYVVIETMQISFNDKEIQKVLDKELSELATLDSALLNYLQDFKFLKLVYYQYINLNKSKTNQISDSINNSEKLDALMKYVNQVCLKNKIKCIVAFHPTLSINNDGTINTNYNQNDLKIMEEACLKNDITFINMEEDFVNYYKKNNVLPHGFNNTIPGQGHLNKYGHMVIAERLKKEIEGDK